MNLTRVIVFCVALSAAGAAVLLVRGMVGGGTPAAQASLPPPATTEVLVASKEISPGRVVDIGSVRWEAWPKESVSGSFIVKSAQPDIEKAVAGIVARAVIVTGQPITDASIVRAGSAGFLAATISPGIFTRAVTDTSDNSKKFLSDVLLHDVRVLAIDQTVKQPEEEQSVVGKTATVEVTLHQAEVLQRARAFGTISLVLRPLGDSGDEITTNEGVFGDVAAADGINVIRYGIARVEEEKAQ
jgi:pilus assembly protein CpaB